MDISNNQFLCNDILIVGYEVDEAGNPPSFSSWVVHIAKSILKKVFAYAIMPIGKKDAKVPCEQRRIPGLCCTTVRGFFFSFIVAKHPLGYLLSLWSLLSSHLQTRWLITPAATAIIFYSGKAPTRLFVAHVVSV